MLIALRFGKDLRSTVNWSKRCPAIFTAGLRYSFPAVNGILYGKLLGLANEKNFARTILQFCCLVFASPVLNPPNDALAVDVLNFY